MIRVDHIQVYNFEGAIRGMRNPLQSWGSSDSVYDAYESTEVNGNYHHVGFIVGKSDLDLMKRLYSAGTSHRKFMRQVFTSMDITAPIYWLRELDTYKVGTVCNSTSIMHTGMKREFTADDFSFEDLRKMEFFGDMDGVEVVLKMMNDIRKKYLETKEDDYFRAMRQLLPSGYNYTITWTANYEVIANIITQRYHHHLTEWREFCDIMLNHLPYLREIMGDFDDE